MGAGGGDQAIAGRVGQPLELETESSRQSSRLVAATGEEGLGEWG